MPPDVPDSPTTPVNGAPSARRVGVLGLGRVGLEYATAVAGQPGFELAGLIDRRADLRGFARAAGFRAAASPALDRLLAKQPLDALVLCAPAAERVEALEAAVAAGLDVLVDGLPVAHAEGAARLEPLLAPPSPDEAKVACGWASLHHPLFASGTRLLAAGTLGTLRQVRASVYVSRVFAPGAPPVAGDVLDFAVVELLALVDHMFGPVRGVSGTAHRLYGERFDEAHATLSLGGFDVGVDASWSVPGYPRAALVVEAEGANGSMIVSDDAIELSLAAPAAGWPEGVTRRVFAEEPDPLAFDAGDYSRPVAAFARALAGGVEPALDPRRALRVARTLAALRRAIAASEPQAVPA